MKSILRLFVCMCFSIACLFSTLIVEAAQMPLDLVIRASQKVAGDWYDASGNKVLSISNGYILEPVFLLFKRLKVEKLFI